MSQGPSGRGEGRGHVGSSGQKRLAEGSWGEAQIPLRDNSPSAPGGPPTLCQALLSSYPLLVSSLPLLSSRAKLCKGLEGGPPQGSGQSVLPPATSTPRSALVPHNQPGSGQEVGSMGHGGWLQGDDS